MSNITDSALLFGVGDGLGMALARRLAKAGMSLTLSSRSPDKLTSYISQLKNLGAPDVRIYSCDVTVENEVDICFQSTVAEIGVPQLIIFNVGIYRPKGILETDTDEFEYCWRTNCLGGFIVARKAISYLLGNQPRSDGVLGTLLFTGATASLRGTAGSHNMAVGKFGLRALAQSLSREFGPEGIHVSHIILDGQIEAYRTQVNDGQSIYKMGWLLNPDAVAESYWHIHSQSPEAWTQELDLRTSLDDL